MERVNWQQAVRPSTHDLIAAINSGADDIERIDGALDDIETVLDGKADVSGTYPDFVAGEALSIRSGIRSNTFLSRALDTDVSDGVAEVQAIKGNTVVWNQLANYTQNHNTSKNGVQMQVFAPDQKVIISGDWEGPYTGDANYYGMVPDSLYNYQLIAGHKYAVITTFELFSAYIYFQGGNFGVHQGSYIATASTTVTPVNSTFRPNNEAMPAQTINEEGYFMIFDLTAMYGAGNEPTTVAEFEAQYPADYYAYSAPTLLSSNIAGIEGASSCEFPAQTLRGIGTAQDAMTKAGIERVIGIRDYASGDESDSSVRTDGMHTAYILATPTTEPFTEPIDLTYSVQAGGSEAWIVPDGTAPTSAAVTGEIAYPLDPARALITHESFADFIDKLGAYIGATITETWDGSKYTYSFASGRSALLGSIEAEPNMLEVTEKDDIVKEIIEDERKEQ